MYPKELAKQIAARAKQVRLALGWSQQELAARAGVSLSTLRVFERTGNVSLQRLLRVATAIHRSQDFERLLEPPPVMSIDELVEKRPIRKRGRTL